MGLEGVRSGGIDPLWFQQEQSDVKLGGSFNLSAEAGEPGIWDPKGALGQLGETGIPIPLAIERRAQDGSYPLSGNFQGEDPSKVLSSFIKEIGGGS